MKLLYLFLDVELNLAEIVENIAIRKQETNLNRQRMWWYCRWLQILWVLEGEIVDIILMQSISKLRAIWLDCTSSHRWHRFTPIPARYRTVHKLHLRSKHEVYIAMDEITNKKIRRRQAQHELCRDYAIITDEIIEDEWCSLWSIAIQCCRKRKFDNRIWDN